MKGKSKIQRWTALVVFLFLGCSAYSQIDLAFVKYLSDNNLHREHLAYIKSLSAKKAPADSIAYLEAKYYLQYPDDSLFYTDFLKSKILFSTDTCAFTNAAVHFLKLSLQMQDRWFGSMDTSQTNQCSRSILSTWIATKDPTRINEARIPQKIRGDFLKYKKYDHRSPVLAGALSAAVPGLGKLYAGRKQSFILTLLTQVGYGAQTYEAVHKLGIKHPFSIFSLSFFGVFMPQISMEVTTI